MAELPARSDADDAWVQTALEQYAMHREPTLRDEIVERTLWLAQRGARRFLDRGEPLDDLVQVARLGLLKTVDRYDPGHGVQFGPYATPTIMGELRRHFRDYTWSMHVSRRAKDLRSAVNEANDELAKQMGRFPRIEEIAARLGVPPTSVIEALEANHAYRAYPLDPATSSSHTPIVESNFEQVLDRDVIIGLLDQLRPRERRILYLRFFEELSQAQIAEKIGTSQVNVGRLITASLAALRQHIADGASAIE